MPLSAKDQELIEGAAVAYQRAGELLAWWKKQRDAKALKYFPLAMPRSQDIQLECFFDTLTLGGKPSTVMATSWKSRFSRKPSARGGAPRLAMDAFLNQKF